MLALNAKGIAKVGYSGTPDHRAMQLRASSPYDWRVCAFYGFGGRILEKRMHDALSRCRVVGEIFEGPLDDIVGVTTVCARAYLRGR
ncbi:GIY-YIG nuclease family protein [Xanthomonas euvesicatoria]|uniref:GIY-YIG nuclease family protein n=1 Tax=Xanthomonas euvesicatoria TaxID=456327 RepID=UPI003D189CE3